MRLVLIALSLCIATIAQAEETVLPAKIAATYYFDTRDFNTLNLEISSNNLPAEFSIWGFTDIHSDQNNGSERFDFTRSFSEYRLSNSALGTWLELDGLGAQIEFNATTPDGDDLLRFGFTYKHEFLSGWLQWRGFPYETDGNGGQISLIYNLPIVERLFISGFVDLNFDDGNEKWVLEPQLNLLLWRNFYLALEYRYNGFEDKNPDLKGSGGALGLRVEL